MSSSTRRAVTAFAATAVITAALGVGASTASAKSDLDLRAASRTVALHGTVRLSAAGSSDDFGGAPIQLCVDQRDSAGHWHRLGCAARYRLAEAVPAAYRGTLAFRAQLIAQTGPHRWVVDRTSPTVSVQIR
jgi:hypothetical protein